MITVTKHDNLNLQFNTDDWDYLRSLKEHFSHYTEGYRYSSLYKVGKWDGRISLFNSMNRTLPFGLLMEWMKFHKINYPTVPTNVDISVKEMFKGIDPIYTKDLLYEPYDYQDDCISAALKTSCGCIISATASGKSLMISYIYKALYEKGVINRGIIIVPSIGLVTQFYNDMKKYGIDMTLIGRVGDEWREWNKPLVISTWQSLSNNDEQLLNMDLVIVDECHQSKARVISELLQKCPNTKWRYGFTGTLPDSELETLQVLSYIGPVLRTYKAKDLAKLGFVSDCEIKMVHIDYKQSFKGDYNEIKKQVFINPYRLSLVKHIIEISPSNILLLTGKVNDEGEYLKKYLKDELGDEYEIVFLSGKDSGDERELWRNNMDSNHPKKIILIATYGIFSTGISINSLDNAVFVSPYKSKIRTLQSLGRLLRLFLNKRSTLWDICDDVKHLRDHSNIRLKHYSKENHDVIDIFLQEGESFTDL